MFVTAREFYKSLGICPNCRKREIESDENSCYECRKLRSDNARKRREDNRDLVNRQQREQYRIRYKRRIDNEECIRCGVKLIDTVYKNCDSCLEKRRNYRRRKDNYDRE